MLYRLDGNRNGSGIIIYVRKDIPIKILKTQNFPEYIEGIFFEIIFRKSKCILYGIYHLPSKNNQYFFVNIDKALDVYCSYEKVMLAGDFDAQDGERLLDIFL